MNQERKVMDQNEIISGCLRGIPESQKALYDEYYGFLMGTCLRYSKNETQAREILEKALVKIYTEIINYNSKESFENWLRKTVIREAIVTLRSNRQEYYKVSTVQLLQESDLRGGSLQMNDVNLIDSADRQDLLLAVQKLSPSQRALFNLAVIDNFAHSEIMQLLEISAETLRLNLVNANYNIKRNLQQVISHSHGN